ncbi:putative glyoxalase superfamily protein PhnB [Aquimarina sp. MAR_2010_214]|nr:putative glyoxalase superfamily protein PhnB [Aquimarina sp. MAR_2010_214]
MQRMKITAGHQQAMPYIVVEKAEDFIDFIRKIFHAQEMIRSLDVDNRIQHSEIRIGDTTILLTEASQHNPAHPGCMYVYVKDTDQTYYEAIDAGAKSLMEPMEEDYGARGAGFQDPFGNTWWIATLN